MFNRRPAAGRLAAFALAALIATVPLAGRAADPYEIYVIGELTGTNAFVGSTEIKAMQQLETQVNRSGGIQGRPLKFIIKDSQTSPQIAVQFMNEAVAKKVPVVLGAGVAATCLAMAGVISKEDGPVLYCWSSGVLPPPGSWIYSSGYSALDQMATGVAFLRDRGLTKISALTSTDATGQDADRNLDNVFGRPENKALDLTLHEHFNITDVSVSAQLARFKQAGAQALIAWSTGTSFGTVLRSLRDAGMDIPVLTTGGNLSYRQMDAYKDIVPSTVLFAAMGQGVIIPDNGASRDTRRAIAQFEDSFKGENVRLDIGYAVAWDGPSLVIQALRKLGTNATAAQLRDYLNAVTSYAGILGPINMKAAPQRGLQKEGIVVVRWDAATSHFVQMSKPGGGPLK